MNLNTDRHGQLEILEGELTQWLDLHEGTNSDPETAEKYRQIVARIQEALMAATIMEDNDVIVLIITDSEIKSGAIKAKLIEVTQNLTEEDRESVERSIQDIIAFEKRTDLLEAESSESIKPENHIRLILKIITDKGGLVYNDDLENGYNAYNEGDLQLGPEKQLRAPITTGVKFNLVVSDYFMKSLKKQKNITRSKGKLFRFPIPMIKMGSIKVNALPMRCYVQTKKWVLSGSLFPNKLSVPLSSDPNSFVLTMFSQSNTVAGFGDNVSSSISGMNISTKVFDIQGFEGSVALNLMRFSQEAQNIVDQSGAESSAPMEFSPLAVVGSFKANLNLLAAIFDTEIEAFESLALSGGLSLAFWLDEVELLKEVLKDQALQEALDKVKDLEKQADNVVKKAQEINVEGQKMQTLEANPKKHQAEIPKQKQKMASLADELVDENKKLYKIVDDIDKGVTSKKYHSITKSISNRVISQTGTAVRKNIVRAVGKLVARAIPIINIACTIYDVISLCMWLNENYGGSRASKGPSALDQQRAQAAIEDAKDFRKAATASYEKKDYVILAMYTELPLYDRDNTDTNGKSMPFRYPLYLKFYKGSSVYRDWENGKIDSDRVKETGNSSAGAGELISFSYMETGGFYERVEAPHNESDRNFGKLELGTFDKQCFKSHVYYKYIMQREALGTVSGSSDYVESPK